MKSWTLVVALALIALSSALPVPEKEEDSSKAESAEAPSVFSDDEDVDESESKNNDVRSIADNDDSPVIPESPGERITKALENVSKTLGIGIKNLGNSAIQILEGTGVAAEQALGTGARIVTGVAETAAEAAETGAKSAIRVANGVANSLTQGTKVLVDTKTQLLKGLTGASLSSPSLLADASSNTESVQRNERANSGGYSSGYGSPPAFGPNTVAETPNNFVNVFSQAAANTVNFGTQLLNSLVGVAANILQGTVSTLLSLLNAKGQVVGAVVQSAPPVLASVTRTAGDVLAAKARIFGAVTQGLAKLSLDTFSTTLNTGALVVSRGSHAKGRVLSAAGKALRISAGATTKAIESIYEAAVSFGSQLARTFGDTFSGLLNRQGGEAGSSGTSPLAQVAQLFSSITGSLGSLGGGRSGSGNGLSGGGGSGNLLGGVGNFAQTLFNAKLNLLNGLLSPFTGGRPLLNFGNRGSSSSSSSFSEPNFRISISSVSSTPSTITVSSPSDAKTSGPLRTARFYVEPEVLKAAAPSPTAELNPINLISTFKSGVFKGIVDTFNQDLVSRVKALTSQSLTSDPFVGSYDSSSSFAKALLPSASNVHKNNNRGNEMDEKQTMELFSKILPLFSPNYLA